MSEFNSFMSQKNMIKYFKFNRHKNKINLVY